MRQYPEVTVLSELLPHEPSLGCIVHGAMLLSFKPAHNAVAHDWYHHHSQMTSHSSVKSSTSVNLSRAESLVILRIDLHSSPISRVDLSHYTSRSSPIPGLRNR